MSNSSVHNTYIEFTAEMITIADADSKISFDDVYEAYRIWLTCAYPKIIMAPQMIVQQQLTTLLGTPSNGIWHGAKLKSAIAMHENYENGKKNTIFA